MCEPKLCARCKGTGVLIPPYDWCPDCDGIGVEPKPPVEQHSLAVPIEALECCDGFGDVL